MSPSEQRARRWLRLYPRQYRERWGEELVATLVDKARDDPRLPVREIAAVVAHAAALRMRQHRLAEIALAGALLGTGLGAAVGWLSAPTIFTSAITSLPAQLELARPSAVLTEQLNLQLHDFGLFRKTSTARATLVRGLTAPYPSCSSSTVDGFATRGLQVRCTSSNARSAVVAADDMTMAIGAMFGHEKVANLTAARARAIEIAAASRRELAALRKQISSTPRTSPMWIAEERVLGRTSAIIRTQRAMALRLGRQLESPGAILDSVGGLTSRSALSAVPIELGAMIGLLLGTAMGLPKRASRSPRRPVHA